MSKDPQYNYAPLGQGAPAPGFGTAPSAPPTFAGAPGYNTPAAYAQPVYPGQPAPYVVGIPVAVPVANAATQILDADAAQLLRRASRFASLAMLLFLIIICFVGAALGSDWMRITIGSDPVTITYTLDVFGGAQRCINGAACVDGDFNMLTNDGANGVSNLWGGSRIAAGLSISVIISSVVSLLLTARLARFLRTASRDAASLAVIAASPAASAARAFYGNGWLAHPMRRGVLVTLLSVIPWSVYIGMARSGFVNANSGVPNLQTSYMAGFILVVVCTPMALLALFMGRAAHKYSLLGRERLLAAGQTGFITP